MGVIMNIMVSITDSQEIPRRLMLCICFTCFS